MDIKVSVIMAVYNAEKHLKQAVDSLLFQTLKEIELILVDDGSSDGSLDILKAYEASDERVRVFVNTEESDGAASARNLGVAKARGEYLAIIDSDDFFEPDMLEMAYNEARKYKSDIVIYDGYRYDDLNGVDLERNSILVRDKVVAGVSGETVRFAPTDNAENLFMMTLGAAWNVLFSAELVRQHDLRFAPFHHADDFEFVYSAFALAERISVIPKRFVHYRVNHAGTQASRVTEWPDTAWQAMLSFKHKLESYGLYDTYRVAYLRVAIKYQLFYLNAMKTPEGFLALYDELRNGRLAELGLADATDEELGDPAFVRMRDIILSREPAAYLFDLMHQNEPFDDAIAWKNNVPRGSAVIVYGGDRLAVDVVHSILWNQDYKLVAWADPQFEELGYPVVSPDTIKETKYDFVIAAARSQGAFEKMKNDLIAIGASPEKIVWR